MHLPRPKKGPDARNDAGQAPQDQPQPDKVGKKQADKVQKEQKPSEKASADQKQPELSSGNQKQAEKAQGQQKADKTPLEKQTGKAQKNTKQADTLNQQEPEQRQPDQKQPDQKQPDKKQNQKQQDKKQEQKQPDEKQNQKQPDKQHDQKQQDKAEKDQAQSKARKDPQRTDVQPPLPKPGLHTRQPGQPPEDWTPAPDLGQSVEERPSKKRKEPERDTERDTRKRIEYEEFLGMSAKSTQAAQAQQGLEPFTSAEVRTEVAIAARGRTLDEKGAKLRQTLMADLQGKVPLGIKVIKVCQREAWARTLSE